MRVRAASVSSEQRAAASEQPESALCHARDPGRVDSPVIHTLRVESSTGGAAGDERDRRHGRLLPTSADERSARDYRRYSTPVRCYIGREKLCRALEYHQSNVSTELQDL